MEEPALLIDGIFPPEVKKSKRSIWKILFLISFGFVTMNDFCAITNRRYNEARDKDPFFPRSMLLLAIRDHRDDMLGVHIPLHRTVLISVPVLLGSLVWTGFYSTALAQIEHCIQEAAEDAALEATINETLLLCKVMLLFKMRKIEESILLYRDTLLPLQHASAEISQSNPSYSVIQSYHNLGNIFAIVGVADYDESLRWLQKAKEAASTLDQSHRRYTSEEQLDKDIQRVQNYQDLLKNQAAYRDLALALASDIKFADLTNTRDTSRPYIQHSSLLAIMAVYLLAKRFRKNPAFGNALQCIFLLNLTFDICFTFIPMPDHTPLSWTGSKFGDILSSLFPARWGMKSLEISRQFLLTFPDEIIHWKGTLMTQFFINAAHLCIQNDKFDTACQIAKVLPEFFLSNTDGQNNFVNFTDFSMISLQDKIEQKFFPDSIFHSFAQQSFFSPSLTLVWVPEILGSFIWTGFFETALLHADKIIAKDNGMDQSLGVKAHNAYSILVKDRILYEMGKTEDRIQIYKEMLLPLLIARVDNNKRSTTYDVINCYHALGILFAEDGVENYEEAIYWVQEGKATMTTFKDTDTFTLVASLDRDMKMFQSYQEILSRNKEYQGLALALAQNVQFADVAPLATNPDHPYFQYPSLVVMMVILLAARQFRKKPSVGRGFKFISFLVIFVILICFLHFVFLLNRNPVFHASTTIMVCSLITPASWWMESLEIARQFVLTDTFVRSNVEGSSGAQTTLFFIVAADLCIRTGKTDEARQIIQALPSLLKADKEISDAIMRERMFSITELEVKLEASTSMLEDLHPPVDYLGPVASVPHSITYHNINGSSYSHQIQEL